MALTDSFSHERLKYFNHMLSKPPYAIAVINGSSQYPSVQGSSRFYQTPFGVLVNTQVFGLPKSNDPCARPIFAYHIHSGVSCTGNADDPFSDALTHYDPDSCPHPYHAGDLPPLFGNNGYAYQAFLTDRFSVYDIIGKTVIIHLNPDDFTTQPSGNAGQKIACGRIEKRPAPRTL